jgi:Putative amidoligase enzyme
MPNISEIFGIQHPIPVKNSKASPQACPDPSLLYGLELEIEGIPCNPIDLYVTGMRGEPDNSLRTNVYGQPWEYITKPATYSILYAMLDQFFKRAEFTMEKNYSERCSVHVHANVLDFNPEQLKSLCLLYQVFERLFYDFAGNDRDKNIFCVPWSQTNMTHQMIDNMTEQGIPRLREWQKYTGMNLIPVATQGTVEFRHMPGTPDINRIMSWCSLIGCLFASARNVPYEKLKKAIIEVNTTSAYTGILTQVFGKWANLFTSIEKDQLLEDGVLDVKYMLLTTGTKDLTIDNLAQELRAATQNPFRPREPAQLQTARNVYGGLQINPVPVIYGDLINNN